MAIERREEVEELLRGVDIVPLTMALVTLTGDTALLDDIAPFVKGPWDYSESIPQEMKDRLIERSASYLLQHERLDVQNPDLPQELVRRMMGVAVGAEVDAEYVPMLVEHMALVTSSAINPAGPAASDAGSHTPGFAGVHVGNRPEASHSARHASAFHVVIVGAGASGLCAAIKLKEANIRYTILEKNDEVGGTWHENRYPGCGVDTPNHFYQFSFEPNNDWPHYYSRQASILAYLKHCADKYQIRENIRFEHEVVSAQYDAERSNWQVQAQDRQGAPVTLQANAVICAVGQLNRPAIPDLPGLDTFAGDILHTAAWRDGADLAGKRVALIGTGASAVQVGPAIADDVRSLHVLQRSGSWVARSPNVHRAVTPAKKWALKHIPFYAEWYRFQLFWAFGDERFKALEIDPEWTESNSISALNEKYRQIMVKHIRRELQGREDLISKVIPDYPPFGKRVLADAGWYAMLKKDHVELVTTPIAQVEPDAVRLQNGDRIPVDTLVFATGFQAGRMLWPMDIKGRTNRSIREIWGDDNPRAYLGISVPEFPNMFVMYGPNTNLGHGGSAIFLAECQMRYIVKTLSLMLDKGLRAVEIRQDVHDDYNDTIDLRLKNLVWSHPSVDGWYKNRDGRIITNQPWRLIDYWRLTYEPDLNHYVTTPVEEI